MNLLSFFWKAVFFFWLFSTKFFAMTELIMPTQLLDEEYSLIISTYNKNATSPFNKKSKWKETLSQYLNSHSPDVYEIDKKIITSPYRLAEAYFNHFMHDYREKYGLQENPMNECLLFLVILCLIESQRLPVGFAI